MRPDNHAQLPNNCLRPFFVSFEDVAFSGYFRTIVIFSVWRVQYSGEFLPNIILLTLCYHHRGTGLNAMKSCCPYSLCSHLNVLTDNVNNKSAQTASIEIYRIYVRFTFYVHNNTFYNRIMQRPVFQNDPGGWRTSPIKRFILSGRESL